MARVEIVMPQMGESITNGTIKKWNKNIGEVVELDEIILEISTDKVESEIPSPVKGTFGNDSLSRRGYSRCRNPYC